MMNTRQGGNRRLECIGENAQRQPKIHAPAMLSRLQPRTSIALKTIALFVLLSYSLAAQAQTGTPTATINWTDIQQTMDGFGGMTSFFGETITDANADLFFSPTNGIGLAYVRTANTWDGGIPDLATLQSAVARGAKIELSLLSPPCTLKHSVVELGKSCTQSGDGGGQPPAFADGSVSSNGTCFTSSQSLATSWATYATYIVNYLNSIQSAVGAPVAILDIQNEPNAPQNSFGACGWGSGAQFDTFIVDNLGPAIAAMPAGNRPKLMLGSSFNWFGSDFSTACLNDSPCAAFISIADGHGYGYPFSPSAYALGTASGRHLWMGETASQGGPYDPSISNALQLATNIHGFLTTASVSGYEYWALAYDTTSSAPNSGLTDQSFNPAKRFYAEGQWSKFVRPGWVRIGATAAPISGVLVTAFKDPVSGNFAIVAVNQTASAQPLSFALTGFTAASVTPWVTSASLDLAQQPSISAAANAFNDTLPASSVTTFVSASSTALLPPTNLHATIH
jgi:glucuronoarabinoxylan endo-1,4-beta-xylanase